MFIVIEGIDGSGKTHLAKALGDALENCFVTAEPNPKCVGFDAIKGHLEGVKPLSDKALMFLFAANRDQHIEDYINPALAAGKHVVCDRYIMSSVVYQGDIAATINRGFLKPDLVIFIDVSPETALKRIAGRNGNISINDTLDKLKAASERYKRIVGSSGVPVLMLDGEFLPDDVIHEAIRNLRALGCN